MAIESKVHKKELQKKTNIQLKKELRECEKEISHQSKMLDKFGPNDKYYNARKHHIHIQKRKRKFIKSELKHRKQVEDNGTA
jgi:hypothetical protein